jgi:hypothetical protein
MYVDFWWRNLKENDHLKDQVLESRIILKRTVINKMEVDWNYVACDTDKWRNSVNTAMRRRVT